VLIHRGQTVAALFVTNCAPVISCDQTWQAAPRVSATSLERNQPRRPSMLERGALATGGLPFAELKTRALINAAAKPADATLPDFSRLIRIGLPGF
jgi:predicted component of type VI protein secretion system